MRISAAIAAGLCLSFTAGGAFAITPTGDWRGSLRVPGHTYNLGLRVRASPGGFQATYDWINLELRNIPLTATGTPADPAFERRSPLGMFVARWDKTTGWRGEWRRSGRIYPVTFAPGVIPPAPVISRVDEISLIVIVALMALEAAGIARLLQLKRRRSARAMP